MYSKEKEEKEEEEEEEEEEGSQARDRLVAGHGRVVGRPAGR